MRKVRHLTAHTTFHVDKWRYASFAWLTWVSHQLSDMSQRLVLDLQTICIRIKIPEGEDYMQPPHKYLWGPFQTACVSLDATFENNQLSIPELKQVEFVLVMAKEDGRQSEDLAREIEGKIFVLMLGLKNRGLLKVTMDSQAMDEVVGGDSR
jgi:hypothetical protein